MSIVEAARAVTFDVEGMAATQGSMKAFTRGEKTFVIPDDPAKLTNWRALVAAKAREAWYTHAGRRGPLLGGVRLDLVFAMPQRKTAPKNWRTNPDWVLPITQSSGDLDKLVRAISDALTVAQVYRDDSQVIEHGNSQHYADGPGCPLTVPGVRITVSEVLR